MIVINIFDLSDVVMGLIGLVFNELNDGLVVICSIYFGKVICDDYWMNYLDEINGLFGIYFLFEIDLVMLYC